ncbi:30S ribosomal protein S15 [Buchnera aphidicola (Chaitoregma tattakana)]|uniref:30S ribosomal protein S15 n=1 Tax=Buchnera aphidicola TaxID=9 RepID=UPI0031B8825E
MAFIKNENEKMFLKLNNNTKDSGSSEAQISTITFRIKKLQKHFNFNKQDHSSKRGLLCMVSKRRKLLNYLKKKSLTRYKNIITTLSIRR